MSERRKNGRGSRALVALVAVALGVVLLGVVGLWALAGWLMTPAPVRALPDEASEVHVTEADLFPDFELYVSARLPEAACRAHVAEEYPQLSTFGSTEVEAEQRMWMSWGAPMDEDAEPDGWWSPQPMDATHTWQRRDGDSWTFVQCADGRYYYYAFSH